MKVEKKSRRQLKEEINQNYSIYVSYAKPASRFNFLQVEDSVLEIPDKLELHKKSKEKLKISQILPA